MCIRDRTVTAAHVPDGWQWGALNDMLRADGVGMGGSYGQLKDVVFRVGPVSYTHLTLPTSDLV